MDWLTVLSSWSSIIGFFISLWSLGLTLRVLKDLRRIERDYLFRVNAPRLVQKVGSHRSAISQCLGDFMNSQTRIEEEIALMKSTLNSLLLMLHGADAGTVKSLLKSTKRYKVNEHGESGLREIYKSLIELEGSVSELQEVRPWQR